MTALRSEVGRRLGSGLRRVSRGARRPAFALAAALSALACFAALPAANAAASPVQSQAINDTNGITVNLDSASGPVSSSTAATGNVLANDLNLAVDPSSITEVSDAKNPSGVLPVSGVLVINGSYGTLTLNATTGNYAYTLDSGVVPPCASAPVDDVFTYTLTDDNGRSSTATIDITLSCVLPVLSQAVDDVNDITVGLAGPGGPVTSATTATGNVLANDLNLDVDPSSITEVSDAKNPSGVLPGSHGVLVIDGTYGTLTLQTERGTNDGNYSYSLDSGVVPPCASAPVDDVFTYTLTDDNGLSSTATIDITLRCVIPTSLVAAPQFDLLAPRSSVGLGVVSATLTSGGSPVAGQTISFSVGATHLCNAPTNGRGVARCTLSILQELRVLLANGYSATFAGAGGYVGTSASTSAVVL